MVHRNTYHKRLTLHELLSKSRAKPFQAVFKPCMVAFCRCLVLYRDHHHYCIDDRNRVRFGKLAHVSGLYRFGFPCIGIIVYRRVALDSTNNNWLKKTKTKKKLHGFPCYNYFGTTKIRGSFYTTLLIVTPYRGGPHCGCGGRNTCN